MSSISDIYTKEDVDNIIRYPHLLAHLVGYDDARLFHSEWIHHIWLKREKKIDSLMCHRGSYKSSVGIVSGMVWRLLVEPDSTIILTRSTFTEAAEGIAAVAKIMKRPEIRELFRFVHGEYPDFKQEKLGDARVDFSFHTATDVAPNLLGLGLTSPWTGKHADIVVTDDISNMQSKISKAKRDLDVRVFREIVANIVNRDGFVRVIGTPWTSPQQNGLESILGGFDPDDPKAGLAPPKKYYIEDTKLIDNVKLEEIRASTTPQEFSANYLLQFTSADDAIFSDPTYIEEWDSNNCERPRAQIDAAYGGEDTTALTIMARRRDKPIIQTVGFLWPQSVFDVLDEIEEKLHFYKCMKIAVEENADKGWLTKELKKKAFSVIPYHESTKKEVKIATYGLEVWEEIRFVESDTDPKYMSQLVDWTPIAKNNHDDAADSMSSLVRQFYSKKAAKQARWQW